MAVGFANTTTTDVDTSLGVADRAVELINNAHADTFPKGYAKRWRDRWLYQTATRQLRRPSPERMENLGRVLAPFNLLDRVFLKLLAVIPGGACMCVAYLSLRMRPYDILPAFWRRIVLSFGKERTVYSLGNVPVSVENVK